MEKMLQQILDGQQEIKKEITLIVHSIARVELTVDEISKTVGRSQGDLMAVLERTATKDSITSLNSKFDLLNDRLFQTENKINLLSIAK